MAATISVLTDIHCTNTMKFAILAAIIFIGIFAYRFAAARSAQAGAQEPADIVIESVQFDPPDGSTLPEQAPILATIRFRFTKPIDEVGVWVRIFDDKFTSQYIGSPERMRPGTYVVTRGAYLTEPGKLDRFTVVFKNAKSAEIFRQDVPVNYTFVADPALDALKKVGAGSTITRVAFPAGKRATVKKGTFIPVLLDYAVNTPDGLFAGTIPETGCSMTYAGLTEPLVGQGTIQMGFTVGEACSVKRVRVALRNAAEGYVHEQFVDVDLTITE